MRGGGAGTPVVPDRTLGMPLAWPTFAGPAGPPLLHLALLTPMCSCVRLCPQALALATPAVRWAPWV